MRFYFLASLCWLFSPAILPAQVQQPVPESIFKVLQQYDPLTVRIETDIKQLKKDRSDEHWQAGVFKVMKGDSVALQLDVELAARGNMRKKTCFFPPVKIRFAHNGPVNDSIADVNELKLVTSCKNTALDEQWVQKECLVYELYNILTEQSFQVKRASVSFANPGKKGALMSSFSFLIESEKEMAARLNAKPIKPRIVTHKSLDTLAFDRLALFQYMIGNTDWSVRVRHNIKVLYLMPSGPSIPIPYDFDYAGVIGTDYALPDPQLPIRTVQERYYMGPCRDKFEFTRVFRYFKSKKEAILSHCEQFPDLPRNVKKQVANYLGEFFLVLDDPDSAKRDIEDNCGKIK